MGAGRRGVNRTFRAGWPSVWPSSTPARMRRASPEPPRATPATCAPAPRLLLRPYVRDRHHGDHLAAHVHVHREGPLVLRHGMRDHAHLHLPAGGVVLAL